MIILYQESATFSGFLGYLGYHWWSSQPLAATKSLMEFTDARNYGDDLVTRSWPWKHSQSGTFGSIPLDTISLLLPIRLELILANLVSSYQGKFLEWPLTCNYLSLIVPTPAHVTRGTTKLPRARLPISEVRLCRIESMLWRNWHDCSASCEPFLLFFPDSPTWSSEPKNIREEYLDQRSRIFRTDGYCRKESADKSIIIVKTRGIALDGRHVKISQIIAW